jgi:K+-transporting ATPase ATPase C chain
MKSLLRPALSLFVVLTAVTGLAYPLVVTGLAGVAFPEEAGGGLLVQDGQAGGSALIGQNFTDPKYFWGRRFATAPMPYNAAASSGSNQGLNPALAEAVQGRIEAHRAAHPGRSGPIPADLVTASASGLDPHISVAAADYQIERVARARQLPPEAVRVVVTRHPQGHQWGVFGEPRVNVLKVNLALDALR